MRPLFLTATLLLVAALAAQLNGCARSHDAALDDAATDPRRGDFNAYYEVTQSGTVYVLGSIQSADKLRNGKVPPTAPGGFSSQGQVILVETDNAGLFQRLSAEYEKRHGLSAK